MSENVQAEARFINPEWKGRSEIPRIYSKETRYANTTSHSVEILDARPLQERGEIDLDRIALVRLGDTRWRHQPPHEPNSSDQ